MLAKVNSKEKNNLGYVLQVIFPIGKVMKVLALAVRYPFGLTSFYLPRDVPSLNLIYLKSYSVLKPSWQYHCPPTTENVVFTEVT